MSLPKIEKPEKTPQEWNEAISAWLDGEESQFDAESLQNPYGRQVWDTYHLIGDVMRSEELAIKPSDLFYARVSKAIDQEPVPASQTKSSRKFGISGLSAVAAAVVAAVVWMVQPSFNGNEPQTQTVAAPVLAAAMDNEQTADSADDLADFKDYLQAHQQLAGLNVAKLNTYNLNGDIN